MIIGEDVISKLINKNFKMEIYMFVNEKCPEYKSYIVITTLF